MSVDQIHSRLRLALEEARINSLGNLARYKFSNFGYHAARWVTLNRILGDKNPNPFKQLVQAARAVIAHDRVLCLRQHEVDFINLLLENNDCCCGGDEPECTACRLWKELCKKTGAVCVPSNHPITRSPDHPIAEAKPTA